MFSVIIPVFNGEKFIEKAIASVFAQTVSDWELVIVNDGSTDGSSTICDILASDDDRVHVIHQENQGAAAARNAAIDLAKGNKKKIHIIGLFEEAEAEQDENGIWQIKLTCTEAATKYIFNIEKLGYLRYKLRCITSLTSRYTYILFIYLEANRFRESWEIELEELKQILNCHEDDLYAEYKRFNERILKRCQKELSEKTECRFTYEPVRRGRSVAAIRFNLEMLSPRIEAEIQGKDPDQMDVFDLEGGEVDSEELAARENRYRRLEAVGSGFDNVLFDEFTDNELIELKSIAQKCLDPEEVEKHSRLLGDLAEAQDFAASVVIAQKMKAMNVYNQRSQIKNRYNYLKKSLLKMSKEDKEN